MVSLEKHKSAAVGPEASLMLRLREALAASWDAQTSYGAVEQAGNPALGQCYPTCRVVQHYFPATEIFKGIVLAAGKQEIHFWNGLAVGETWYHIDFSWQQFSTDAVVQQFVVLDRNDLDDSEGTRRRCALLLERVQTYLNARI